MEPVLKDPINVVFDIDGVLCDKNAENMGTAAFFLRKGAILTAIKTHYVFPGVIELMQLLFSQENVKVSFFSSGAKERNEVFVRELLVRSLGELRYEQVAENVAILSREHMVKNTEENGRRQYKEYGMSNGNYKKDLTVLVKDDGLSNTVLIEDNPSYVHYTQVGNMLIVPGTQCSHFERCAGKAGVRRTVQENGGQTTSMFLTVNRICYLAGVLFKAMETARQEEVPLKNVLFRWHFKPCEETEAGQTVYKPIFEKLYNKESFYRYGLEKLRSVNPEFSETSPVSYLECVNVSPTEEEKEILEAARANEDNGCVIC